MRQLLLVALTGVSLFAASDRLMVHRAQMGNDAGKIVLSGDQLLFIDDTDPAGSFSIPRADILSLRMNNGTLALDLANGSLRLMDSASTGILSSWTGLALNSADRMASMPADDMQFNIRHDDDTGRLLVGDTGLAFEALSNARKSRRWSYGEIKEFKRDAGDRQFKLKTYGGEDFKFRLVDRDMSTDVYNLIADRIVSARRPQ